MEKELYWNQSLGENHYSWDDHSNTGDADYQAQSSEVSGREGNGVGIHFCYLAIKTQSVNAFDPYYLFLFIP